MGNFGGSDDIELTARQEAGIAARISRVEALVKTVDFDSGFDQSNPHHRLFFDAFDGTGNNRDNIPPGGRHTNPDVLQSLIHNSVIVASDYISGVGTDCGLDRVNYVSGEGTVERAEEAYELLLETVSSWYRDDPNAEIYISLAGFSRGTGSARHFANLVYERGVPAPDAQASREFIGFEDRGRASTPIYRVSYDKYIIPPGEAKLDTMLLDDSVTTGQTRNLKLGIPPVKGLAVLHLTANDEMRDQFDLQSIIDPANGFDPRLYEFGLPGVHGDVGGAYANDWLSDRYLELGHIFLRRNGVPLRDIPEQYRASSESTALLHDSDQWFYTTFGDRRITNSDNEALDGVAVLSSETAQRNLLARLEYVDSCYAGARGSLEWAQNHPQQPGAAEVLRRHAGIEREMERLSEARDAILSSGRLTLDSMGVYTRRTTTRQWDAEQELQEVDDGVVGTVSVLTGQGGLNPEFIASLNTPAIWEAFLAAPRDPQTTSVNADSLPAAYAAFVYNKALSVAAEKTGRSVAEILDLDVPGNPNAAGYNYEPRYASTDTPFLAGLKPRFDPTAPARLLGVDEDQIHEWLVGGELDERIGQRINAIDRNQDTHSGLRRSRPRCPRLRGI